MWIVAGTRTYGRVDEWRGEFAHTRFGHLWFVPVVPEHSEWVTTALGTATVGFPIRTAKRSVLATYARWYAPIVAVAALARAPLVVGIPVAAAMALVVAWGWSVLKLRGAWERRLSDYHLLAFGARCAPALLLPADRARLDQSLRERWALVGGGRSPEDVARFGASDARQAVVAYGILRLASLSRGATAAGALADRIVRGQHDEPVADSPYRSAVAAPALLDRGFAELLSAGRLTFDDAAPDADPDATEPPVSAVERGEPCGDVACPGGLGEDARCKTCGLTVPEGETANAERFAAREKAEADRRRGSEIRTAKQTILLGGLGVGAVLALGVAWLFLSVMADVPRVSVAEVQARVDRDQEVEVRCDRVLGAGTIERRETDSHGNDTTETDALVLCLQGGLAMPIFDDLSTPTEQLVRRGRAIAVVPDRVGWYPDPGAAATPAPYVLVPVSHPIVFPLLFGIALLGVAGAALGKGVRDLRRLRRDASAS